MSHDLRAYLKGLATVGEFDSEGRFTVDVHKRNIKIRESRFTESTAYLLCCVRAAVTAESDQVFIRLKHASTLVVLKEPKELRAEDIVESVLGSSALSHTDHLLGAAVQGGLAAGASRVKIKLPDSEIKLTQDALKVTPRESSSSNVSLSFEFPGDSWSRRRRCHMERQAVLSRCCFCPVPIVMDGLSVTDKDGWESLLQWQRTGESYGVHKDFVWLEAFLPEPGSPFSTGVGRRKCRVEYVGGDRYKTSDWDPREPNVFLRIVPRSEGKRHSVGMFVRQGSLLEGTGRLYLVKQGVTLEPIEVDLEAPGVAVVVRGDEFETDISLFKPILEGEVYDRLVRQVRANVKALAVQLGRERKNFGFTPLAQGEMLRRAGLLGTGGAVVGLLTGPGGALVLGGAMFVLSSILLYWRNTDQMLVEAEQRVRWELDAFVNMVAPEDDGKTRL